MLVRVVLPQEVTSRIEAVSPPLARRAAIVRRLIEVGLARVERHPEDLRPPRPTAGPRVTT